MRAYLLGLLVFGLFASNVPAQIYRWVDDKGTVHFTDERPRHQSGVKEVVSAGAQRTPMVRGGPEWRVDTPTPDFAGSGGRGDDFDDEYGDEDLNDYGPPRQGDTIIEVYEPPPWFDEHDTPPHHHDRGHVRDGSRDGDRGGGHRDRGDARPPIAAAPPSRGQAPPVARPPSRAASRALPIPR
jgi:Domain of unknown function (DUF4124)